MSLKEALIEHLRQIKFLLEFHGENPFKVRAFGAAEESLSGLNDDELQVKLDSGKLTEIKGIGKGIAQVSSEFAKSGSSRDWAELKGSLPDSIFELTQIKGLGPKKIKQLYDELGVSSLSELEYACVENRLVSLSGIKEKSQAQVLSEIERIKSSRGKHLLSDALKKSRDLSQKFRDLKTWVWVGELGQKREIVSCLELLTLETQEKKPRALRELKALFEETSAGLRQVSTQMADGFELKLHFCRPAVFGLCSVYLCSSEDHWRSLEKLAQKKSVCLVSAISSEEKLPKEFETEEGLYRFLDLPYHPPECREYAAKKLDFSALVDLNDLSGSFHAHSTYSDGSHSLREMAEAARARGWKYLGISEHSGSAFYAQGLKEAEIKKQWKEIDSLNKELRDFQILKGIESDILKDGSLDYSESVLGGFDFVIASIHQRYGMSEMTDRLLVAIQNPYTQMIGHLSGRLLLGRAAYALDIERIVRACIETGTIIELNANPHRLDVDWRHLREACEGGLLISINADAHSIDGFDDTQFGVWMARKGFVQKSRVINTWPLDKIQVHFGKKRSQPKARRAK